MTYLATRRAGAALPFLGLKFLAAAGLAIALSGGTSSATEKPDHYEKPVFESTADAISASRNMMLQIQSALIVGAFDDIHEATYTLEAAAKVISGKLGEHNETGEAFADRVEIVHIASELADKAILDAAVPSLNVAMETAINAAQN